MIMNLDDFCLSIKNEYPDISKNADKLYDDYWNSLVEMEFSAYSWFESLANALNEEMNRQACAVDYISLLTTISQSFVKGDDEVRNTIDTAFVENLYWKIPVDKATPFWDVMPNNLKALYIEFHNRTPV